MAEQQKSATSAKPEHVPSERDEPVKIDLAPEVALQALLKVDPEAPPAPRNEDAPVLDLDDPEPPQGDPISDA